MQIIKSLRKMQLVSNQLRNKGYSIGFVPTMGALHEGHLSLMRKARQENDKVIVSIFVNPTQFGPKEDFKKYPRDFKTDARLCLKEKVDIIFYPSIKAMYPEGYKTYVEVEDLSDVLCGKFRRGHFRGVTTVVTKLFNLVWPNIAYFGQKDAQQAVIIKKMVEDLNIPVKIKVMPTIREKDGLAMSSRNKYLNPKERKKATILYKALRLAKNLINQGEDNPLKIKQKMYHLLKQEKLARVQYIEIVDLKDLRPLKKIIKKNTLIALAVFIGKTRLIDNLVI